MAMQIGDDQASSGMAKSIYDQMDEVMKPTVPPASLEDARKGWKKLAFAIAAGVVTHLKSNMEISNIQTQGDINAAVTGTASGTTVTGKATGSLTAKQTGPVTGHVS
jgi:hypothetical protein